MTLSRYFPAIRAVGAALVPAVALVCCAGQAQAGCGDYVTIIGPDGQAHAPAGHDSPSPNRPCQGPECTGGPKAPAPIPPAPTNPSTEAKALPVTDTEGPGTGSAGRCPPAADGSPVRQPHIVFHPPRAS